MLWGNTNLTSTLFPLSFQSILKALIQEQPEMLLPNVGVRRKTVRLFSLPKSLNIFIMIIFDTRQREFLSNLTKYNDYNK